MRDIDSPSPDRINPAAADQDAGRIEPFAPAKDLGQAALSGPTMDGEGPNSAIRSHLSEASVVTSWFQEMRTDRAGDMADAA